ncbi:MAG: M23 family metallopeptidase [Acidimicrobiales bacterium]
MSGPSRSDLAGGASRRAPGRLRRAVVALLSVVAVTAAAPTVTSAQEGPGTDPTAPATDTTSPPTTAPPTTAPPTTLPVPGGSGSGGTTTTSGPGPDGSGPDASGPAGTVAPPVDPVPEEGPGETVPDTDVTVPPATGGGYGGQGAYRPPAVVWGDLRAAETRLAEADAAHQAAVDGLRAAEAEHAALDAELADLDGRTQQVVADLERTRERLVRRAVAGFVADEAVTGELVGSLIAEPGVSAVDHRVRGTLLGAAIDVDDTLIADYVELRARLETDTAVAVEARADAAQRIVTLTAEVDATGVAVEQAGRELEVFSAGSSVYIPDVVFPVAEGYATPLIDSFGFPRMPGTPDAHWHEGIDIFAPAGTPLLAAERGVITKVGSNRLGGLSVWLRGASGADWYYAHLLTHAPGLHVGQVVEAGTVLGTVGNSGNAASTPAHLHLQLHPGGGSPVNPYPLLKSVSDRDAVLRAAQPSEAAAAGAG